MAETLETTIRAAFEGIASMTLPDDEPADCAASCDLCERDGLDTHTVHIEWRDVARPRDATDACHDCLMAWHYGEWSWLDA